MTKEQIIRSISDEFKISELESIQFYENVFQFIEGSFKKSRNLNISEFGKFNVIEKTASDGARINSVKFSPSRKLATEVNYNYNNLAKILFRDIERNMNKERILSLGEENVYREQSSTESAEVFDRYSEEEKDFIEQQVNFTSSSNLNYSNSDLSDLEQRVRKVEAFIDVIRRFFEEQKLGAALKEVKKTEVVPQQADYIKRSEEDRIREEKYKASISALEQKIKDLEHKFTQVETQKTETKTEVKPEGKKETKEEKIILPPLDENVEAKKITSGKDLGNLVVESDYSAIQEITAKEVPVTEATAKEIQKEVTKEKPAAVSHPIIESVPAPVIEEKIEDKAAEIKKEVEAKETETKEASTTSNIDDLLRTLSAGAEEKEVPTAEEKIQEVTNEFFVKAEEPESKIVERKVEPVEEVKEPSAEKIADRIQDVTAEKVQDKVEEKQVEIAPEEKVAPTTNLVGEISDSELHDKVDSIIQEFKAQSGKTQETEEVTEAPVEEPQQPEEIIDYSKPSKEQEPEEAQLSMALSSIFNSILQSENINKESSSPIIKEDVKNLHDEIIKTDKPAETEKPAETKKADEPDAELKDINTQSISDIYAGAKSFNDVFEETKDTGDAAVKETNGHGLKETNGHGLKETNGHGLKETNGHGLKETNGHGLKETNGHGLKEGNGHGLKETNGHGLGDTYSHGHSLPDEQGRTSKIYTNGNPLKPYSNGNGKHGNGHSTLNQVLEDNGLQKESKSSIFVIGIVILVALALLFFAIFSSGIMGKENHSSKENNFGLVKIKEVKNEKYFYDNGKDKVYFQTEAGFTIQVSSYKDKQTAIDKRKSLMDKKVENVRIEELENNGETFYRVRIGMFKTLDEAKNYSTKF